jgi:mannose/fructose-specific phosphotransferase system component IIA
MKNDKKETNDEHNGYLFSVDVLIKGRTNGHALEVLTHLLNEEQVTDYRIIKGINLGQIITANLEKPKEKITQPKSGAIADHKSHITTVKKESKAENKSAEPKISKQNQIITQQIEKFKEDKSLVRISINKGKGVNLSIPCRILNFDWTTGNITAYHVDEKKVYSIDLSEIDDLTSG